MSMYTLILWLATVTVNCMLWPLATQNRSKTDTKETRNLFPSREKINSEKINKFFFLDFLYHQFRKEQTQTHICVRYTKMLKASSDTHKLSLIYSFFICFGFSSGRLCVVDSPCWSNKKWISNVSTVRAGHRMNESNEAVSMSWDWCCYCAVYRVVIVSGELADRTGRVSIYTHTHTC